MGSVPMRQECKNFESRTYANGETVRKCNLDLAPEAPWRCPDPCSGFERRRVDAGWTYGSLANPDAPDEPPGLDDGSAAAVLDEAEEIVNAIGADVLADMGGNPSLPGPGGTSGRRWRRLFRRRR